MDNGAGLPAGWWRSGLIGVGASVPIVWAVGLLAGKVDDDLGGIVVFLVYGPAIVAAVALFSAIVVWGNAELRAVRWRLSWVIAAPVVVGLVLVAGAAASGPDGSVTELRVGWSLVVVLMYGAAGVAFGLGVSRRTRVLASAVLVAAAPLMIAYDDLAQDRWRRAAYASAPHVLPVVPGYTVVAARGTGTTLDVDLHGPVDLQVSVWRCGDCAARREQDVKRLTIVDGSYQLEILALQDAAGPWSAPDGIGVRPAGLDELAALPPAARRGFD